MTAEIAIKYTCDKSKGENVKKTWPLHSEFFHSYKKL